MKTANAIRSFQGGPLLKVNIKLKFRHRDKVNARYLREEHRKTIGAATGHGKAAG
jgi:hypothetical protein